LFLKANTQSPFSEFRPVEIDFENAEPHCSSSDDRNLIMIRARLNRYPPPRSPPPQNESEAKSARTIAERALAAAEDIRRDPPAFQ